MKWLIVDRFEGEYAVCENCDGSHTEIEIWRLPKDAKEGSVISISDRGELSLGTLEEYRRRKMILEKQKRLRQGKSK